MADKNTLKNWFLTGLKPTQAQFHAWMDSYWHKDEPIPQSKVQNLTNTLNAKAEKSQFDAHKTDVNAHPELVLIARIVPVGELIVYKVAPNENNNELEPGDYCTGIVEGVFINSNYLGGDKTLLASYE